jgi:S-adenosylmethionine synthetase
MVLVFGEITTKAVLDYNAIVRSVVKRIGFNDSSLGMLYFECCFCFVEDPNSN